MTVVSQRFGDGGLIRCKSEVIDPIEPRLFDVDWVRANGYIHQSGMGRGGAHILKYSGHDVVLRFFLRGGIMRRINRDRYLRLGEKRSRSFREYELLRWMNSQGLRVPKPIAAMTAPTGVFYRAAIILECIPQARTLADVLREGPLPNGIWSDIGKTIRDMHELQVFHADLNCRNVLIDDADRVWLIDFDKSRRRKRGRWMTQNIERLRRSLLKERGTAAKFWMDDQDWFQLVDSYQASHDGKIDVAAKRA